MFEALRFENWEQFCKTAPKIYRKFFEKIDQNLQNVFLMRLKAIIIKLVGVFLKEVSLSLSRIQGARPCWFNFAPVR